MNVMCDLETLGVGPKAAIISIGCVAFNMEGLGNEFYVNVDAESAQKCGMDISASTVMWWMGQDEQARKSLITNKKTLPTALMELVEWMPGNATLWGNGATFDNVILRSAYDLCGIKAPWHFRDDRCYRTLKAMVPRVATPPDNAGKHNALADARWQAQHAVNMLRALAGLAPL